MSTAAAPPIANGKHNGELPLSPKDLADCRASALTDETIRAAGIRTETNGRALAELLNWRNCKGEGMVIPFPPQDGSAPTFNRVKLAEPIGPGRKYEHPKGAAPRLYIPPGVTRAALRDVAQAVDITEGEKKSLCADQHGNPTVGLIGVDCWAKSRPKDARGRGYGPFEPIDDLKAIDWKGRLVRIVFDSDAATNPGIQRARWRLARWLRSQGAVVKVVTIPEGPAGEDGKPAKVGVDDYIVAHGPEAYRKLLDDATDPVEPENDRPKVILGVEEHLAVEAATRALAKGDRGLFQRGGQLARVVRPSKPQQSKRLQLPAALRIEPVPTPDLRIRLTRHARCIVVSKDKKGDPVELPTRPTRWLVEGVGNLGLWQGVRHLEGVVESPVLRPDGSVLDRPGYDRSTGLLYRPCGNFPPMPAAPTKDDAVRAVGELLEVVEDFPFVKRELGQAVFLSVVLTPAARFAFDGPAPMHHVDSNVRGSGKGLQLDAGAVISLGREMARASYTDDSTELAKTITAIALAGERDVNFDNLTGSVGNSALDAALTATSWHGRILGKSQQPRVPMRCTFYSSGNNIVFRADTARRVLQSRLESPEENPENRQGFKHPDLLAWVRENRGRLLVAALTILAAYFRAGCPLPSGLKPWGSFEGWTRVVRGAIAWAGQRDPGEARMTAVTGGDKDAEALKGLIAGWGELDVFGSGLTVAQALKLLDDKDNSEKFATMRDVLADLFNIPPGRLPKTGQLGYRLRAYSGRNCGGKCFVNEPGGGGVARWRVVPFGQRRGGDGGDGGDTSANLYARKDEAPLSHTYENQGETSPPSPPSQQVSQDFEEGEL